MLPHGHALVAVGAVGLNFRDVLNVLGMYPGDAGAPGAQILLQATQIFPSIATSTKTLSVIGAKTVASACQAPTVLASLWS